MKHHKFHDEEELEVSLKISQPPSVPGVNLMDLTLKHFYGGQDLKDYRAKRWFYFFSLLTTLTWALACFINHFAHLTDNIAAGVFVIVSTLLQLACYFSFLNPDLSVSANETSNQSLQKIRWWILLGVGCGYGSLMVLGAWILIGSQEILEVFVSAFLAFQIALALNIGCWAFYNIFVEYIAVKRLMRATPVKEDGKALSLASLETEASATKEADNLAGFFARNKAEVAKILSTEKI